MNIKLIDVMTTEKEVMLVGTCDLCFEEFITQNPVYVFELEDGRRVEVNGSGYGKHGFYAEYRIPNPIRFAEYLQTVEVTEETQFNFLWLQELLIDYYGRYNPNRKED